MSDSIQLDSLRLNSLSRSRAADTNRAMLVFLALCSLYVPLSSAQDSELPLAGADSLLFMPQTLRQQAFGNVQTLSETRTVAASDNPHRLVSKPQDWSDFEYEVDGETFSLDDYFQRPASRGLIVLQGDEVLLERYGSGNTPETRWITFSVTKSVTSLCGPGGRGEWSRAN